MRQALFEQLKEDEGLRLKAYRCSAGKLTIGYGRNVEEVGISAMEAEQMLANDLRRVEGECLHAFPWFADLDPVRQDIILNMCFNLGLFKLRQFVQFLHAVSLGNYDTAADEMLNSLWAEQVKGRAIRLAAQMRGSSRV